MLKSPPPRSQRAVRTATASSREEAALSLGFETTPQLLAFGVLCLVLLLAPANLSGFWPSDYEYLPQSLLLGGAAVACLVLALSQFEVQSPKSKVGWLLLAFFGWSCLSLATTVYRHDSLIELSRVGGCLIWFWIARQLLATSDEGTLRARLLVLGGAVIIGAVWICLVALNSYRLQPTRQFSTFYNPNLFANYCALVIPLALAWTLECWRNARDGRLRLSPAIPLVVGTLSTFIVLAGLLVSGSKGGLLSLFLGLLVFAIAIWRARSATLLQSLRTHRTAFAVAAILIAVVGGALFMKTVAPRLASARGAENNSTMFRVYTWQSTLKMAQARPLLGWGAGTFPSAYSQFATTSYTRSAHQSWLQIAAETGVPSLLLLLGAFGVAAAHGWKHLRSAHWPFAAGGLAALIAMLAHGMTDSGWNISSILLLVVLTLAILDTQVVESPDSPLDARHSSLSYAWLGWTLLLAFASSQLQRAATAQSLFVEAQPFIQRGAGPSQAEKALQAVDADPLSARMRILQAQTASSAEAALPAIQKATELQPTRAANWLGLARLTNTSEASKYFDRAVELEPNETSTLLARAKWRLENNDARGWQDLEKIAALADAPYGRYRPVEEIVNLDFLRAYVQLAPRAIEQKKLDLARRYIERGLQDVQEAQKFEARRRELAQASGVGDDGTSTDLSQLEAQLKALQQQLKS